MNKEVIVLNGLPGAGKDMFADYLVKKYGYIKKSFADELKNILCRTFKINRTQLDEYKNNPERYSILLEDSESDESRILTNFRDLLRRFGTEGMKPVFGDDVWARIVYDEIVNGSNEKIVISDFRFLVEYKINKEYYSTTSILVLDDRPLPTEGHSSDTELYNSDFDFDLEIYNPKNETYFKSIDNIMRNK